MRYQIKSFLRNDILTNKYTKKKKKNCHRTTVEFRSHMDALNTYTYIINIYIKYSVLLLVTILRSEGS